MSLQSIRKKRTKTREMLHHLPSVAAVFLTLGTSNRVVVLCELFDRALHDLLGRHLRKEIALFLHFFQIIKWRKKGVLMNRRRDFNRTERNVILFVIYIKDHYERQRQPHFRRLHGFSRARRPSLSASRSWRRRRRLRRRIYLQS